MGVILLCYWAVCLKHVLVGPFPKYSASKVTAAENARPNVALFDIRKKIEEGERKV